MIQITRSHKYEYGFITLSDIELSGLPEKLEIEGKTLIIKHEFHISLISPTEIAKLIDSSNIQNLEAEIISEFKTFEAEYDLSRYNPTNSFRLAKKEELMTVLQLVDVPNLSKFFDTLKAKYRVEIPLQPTHITLYTLQPNGGIGMISKEQLNTYSKEVSLPELEVIAS